MPPSHPSSPPAPIAQPTPPERGKLAKNPIDPGFNTVDLPTPVQPVKITKPPAKKQAAPKAKAAPKKPAAKKAAPKKKGGK